MKTAAIVLSAYVVLVLAAFIGWVMNIVAIVHAINGPVSAMFIARLVGVVVAPLGSVLGWL